MNFCSCPFKFVFLALFWKWMLNHKEFCFSDFNYVSASFTCLLSWFLRILLSFKEYCIFRHSMWLVNTTTSFFPASLVWFYDCPMWSLSVTLYIFSLLYVYINALRYDKTFTVLWFFLRAIPVWTWPKTSPTFHGVMNSLTALVRLFKNFLDITAHWLMVSFFFFKTLSEAISTIHWYRNFIWFN